MTLKDFLKMLDTIMPIKIYYDGDDQGTYKAQDIPKKWLDQKVFQIFIDEWYEYIGVDLT